MHESTKSHLRLELVLHESAALLISAARTSNVVRHTDEGGTRDAYGSGTRRGDMRWRYGGSHAGALRRWPPGTRNGGGEASLTG
uniref:Uncharacterized protein n=1 Tax=Oryza punctata TaxID=4537 RepID=A0A0E0K430_ORYPU